MPEILKDYFDALKRLEDGKPVNLPKGTKITNDSVSQEAGRKKGTIKKSRPVFSELIEAIAVAARAQSTPEDKLREQLLRLKEEVANYRRLWEEALAREISLVVELRGAREAWGKEREAIVSGKVTPIKSPAT